MNEYETNVIMQQDLAYALRDGVLLCHLVHTIDGSTLDMKLVNQRPSLAQFLCLKVYITFREHFLFAVEFFLCEKRTLYM